MKIDIAVACVYFQRRLCYMLSSLSQQINPPEITIDIAYQPNNGSPTTEAVIDFFLNQQLARKEYGVHTYFAGTPNLKIRQTLCGDEIKGKRGTVRERQLQQSKADWILFGDCDHVYHPDFFNDLATQLAGPFKDDTKCLASTRISLAKDHCKDFFNRTLPGQYPCFIPDAAQTVSTWPVYRISPAMGAGYFQMANVDRLRRDHGGHYVPPKARRDNGWHTKSDRYFRQMLGGVARITTKPQYHLNHERPREEGLPDDIQR